MNNTENKLDALIAAMGFDVEVVSVGNYELIKAKGLRPAIVQEVFDYKLTKRNINSESLDCYVACVPLPVQSDAWGSIVNYCADHVDDIENGVNDFDTLRPIWEFMKGKGNE
jgi:hypothetical protein